MTDLPQCRIRELQFERQKAKEELAEFNKGMECSERCGEGNEE